MVERPVARPVARAVAKAMMAVLGTAAAAWPQAIARVVEVAMATVAHRS